MTNDNQGAQPARNETHILADIAEAKASYAEMMSTKRAETTLAQQEEAVDKIKTLSRELDDFLVSGANDCGNCGHKPMGMLKTPAYEDRGVEYPAVLEVGCVHCPPVIVERANGKALIIDGEVKTVKRRSYSARATSQAEAVRKWNAQEFVEDFLFDRIPGFTPVEAEASE
jgi:hypothetical protein